MNEPPLVHHFIRTINEQESKDIDTLGSHIHVFGTSYYCILPQQKERTLFKTTSYEAASTHAVALMTVSNPPRVANIGGTPR